MKKKLLTTIGSVLLSAFSFGQVVLTNVTNNPSAGEVFYAHQCDTTGINKGASGSAVFWNLSTLTEKYIDTINYIACNTTNYCDTFPGSDLVATDNHGNYRYYNASANSLSNTGIKIPGISTLVSDPQDLIYYPLSLGSKHVDSAHLDGCAPTTYVSYIDSFECDGYGFLTLPCGTFSNTLRVHEIVYLSDYVHGYLNMNMRTDYYFWYTSGLHAPLMGMKYDTTGSGVPHIQSVYFNTRLTTGVNEISNEKTSHKLFPNPATNELKIQNNHTSSIELKIYSNVGALVVQQKAEPGVNEIDISMLTPGIYYIKIVGPFETESDKFIKSE